MASQADTNKLLPPLPEYISVSDCDSHQDISTIWHSRNPSYNSIHDLSFEEPASAAQSKAALSHLITRTKKRLEKLTISEPLAALLMKMVTALYEHQNSLAPAAYPPSTHPELYEQWGAGKVIMQQFEAVFQPYLMDGQKKSGFGAEIQRAPARLPDADDANVMQITSDLLDHVDSLAPETYDERGRTEETTKQIWHDALELLEIWGDLLNLL